MNKPASTADSARTLRRRRFAFLALTLLTAAAMLYLMALTLFPGGIDPLGVAMLVAFAVTLPWTVVGFWNALIGLALMTFARNPAAFVAPQLEVHDGSDPISASTALLVCVRNEDPQRLRRNLEYMVSGLATSPAGRRFHLYVLSDSSEPSAAAGEAAIVEALARRYGEVVPVTYRRREDRAGYKAGNIRDFCERWGTQHEFAIVLDADSLMTPESMMRIVRIMQRHPQLGILQTLVTGLPSTSAFARMFQFGMRLGMRSYTLGAAFWQGDCGPYWGHNAIIRLDPFIRHCQLPVLPGGPPLGGHVLSHDQVEAVLMRRAGYEVRVLAEEGGSWEENPPALTEFIRRDLRWCQGNMQYFPLLRLPGLLPLSRCQLLLAIVMYLSPAGWMGFLAIGMFRSAPLRADVGFALFALTLAMTFAPKAATLADVLARRRIRRAFGGTLRLLLGAVLETLFWMLTAPICAFAVTLFLLGIPFGRQIGWSAQQRDVAGLPLAEAARRLWPQTLAGTAVIGWYAITLPGAFWWLGMPVFVGLALSIPLASLTAHPALGRVFVALGLCRIPEETQLRTVPPPSRPLAALGSASQERAP